MELHRVKVLGDQLGVKLEIVHGEHLLGDRSVVAAVGICVANKSSCFVTVGEHY